MDAAKASHTDEHVLITGASGFVGEALAAHLAGRYSVLGLSRRPPAIDVPSVPGQFHSWEDLRRLDKFQISAVVHLAAVTGGCSEEDGLAINVQGTRRLVRYLLDRGCRKFVMASSIAAVGCLHSQFIPLQLPIPDEHPCLARDAYGLSKAMMEELTRYFQRANPHTEFINLRLGAVADDAAWTPPQYTGEEPLAIPFTVLAQVLLSDVVQAITTVLEAPLRPAARVYNLVGPDAPCKDTVPEVLRASCGGSIEPLDFSWYERPGHQYDPLYAMDTIKNDFGFAPQKSTRLTSEQWQGATD